MSREEFFEELTQGIYGHLCNNTNIFKTNEEASLFAGEMVSELIACDRIPIDGYVASQVEGWRQQALMASSEIDRLRIEVKRLREGINGIVGYYSLVASQNDTEKRTVEILLGLLSPAEPEKEGGV